MLWLPTRTLTRKQDWEGERVSGKAEPHSVPPNISSPANKWLSDLQQYPPDVSARNQGAGLVNLSNFFLLSVLGFKSFLLPSKHTRQAWSGEGILAATCLACVLSCIPSAYWQSPRGKSLSFCLWHYFPKLKDYVATSPIKLRFLTKLFLLPSPTVLLFNKPFIGKCHQSFPKSTCTLTQ